MYGYNINNPNQEIDKKDKKNIKTYLADKCIKKTKETEKENAEGISARLQGHPTVCLRKFDCTN